MSIDASKCMVCGRAFKYGERARATVEWYPAGVTVADGLLLMTEQVAHADGCSDAASVPALGEIEPQQEDR